MRRQPPHDEHDGIPAVVPDHSGPSAQAANRSKLDVVLDSVNAAIVTIDTGGRILDVNRATNRLFGYATGELLGQNVSMLMPHPHRAAHDDYIRRYLETGQSTIIGTGRTTVGRRSDGSMFPIHLAIGEHRVGDETRFTGIVHDLSDQERIAESNTRLGRILDESQNEVYVFDAASLRFSIVSRGAQANLGYTLDELRQLTPIDIKPDFNRNSFERLIAPLRAGSRQRIRFETRHQRKDSSCYDVEVSLNLTDATSPPEFLAIVQDVTERNQLMEAFRHAQKMESIGQLTGGIAHDFNNILTVISGNLELSRLRLGDTSPQTQELLQDALDATVMGARLTNRLLAFASRSSLSPQPIDVNGFIDNIAQLMRRTLGEQISLTVQRTDSLWDTLADVSQLENAMANLLINARDAMPAGGALSIRTGNARFDAIEAQALGVEAGDYVSVSVQDSGCGIPESELRHIFEPFYTTKSGSHSGTGLGLSMVYGFARQSGGAVTVTSQPDQGSTFTLYLPRSVEAMPELDDRSEVTPDTGADARRLLVVEDDDQVRRLTVRRLQQLGHQVQEAVDGPSALTLLRADPTFDLLFTDMIMTQGMTGLDLALAARRQNPDIKVLIATGYAEELVNTESLIRDGFLVLRKPYSNQQLTSMLQQLFAEL